jgi:predicted permease
MWRKSSDARRASHPRGGRALGGKASPPRLAESLLRRFAGEDRDPLLGDLAEEFRDVRLPRDGRGRARRWYWVQTIRSLAGRLRLPDRDPPERARRAGPFDARTTSTAAPASAGAVHHTGDGPMSNLLRDVRYGLRALLQTPTFTAVTILTLALAIGVNTAIFSMVNVLMFRPLPIKETGDVGFFYFDHAERGLTDGRMSPADFLDFRERFTSFREMAAVHRGRDVVMTGHDTPEQVLAFEATANTFEMWGVETVLGRGFQPGEDAVGAPRVVVLSHGVWEQRFGADPAVLGRAIKLDEHETTIVGVLSPEMEFGGLSRADIWVPLYLGRASAPRDVRNLWVSGRLRTGATLEAAQQEAHTLWRSLIEEHPETNGGFTVRVEDINGALGGDQVWTTFYMLLLTVVFVLLIACSNVATMMLSRASGRSREIAVRAALGAGRGRILRQLLTESLLLSVVSGALGLVFTRLCLDGLVWMVGDNAGTNFFHLLGIDRNVLAFSAGVALLAPLLFGFVPALRASRADLVATLKDSARGSSGAGGLRGRRLLVATQVSLALALMVVAGLLVRFLIDLRTQAPGFEIDGVLTMQVALPEGKYAEWHQWQPFFDAALERIEALPGVAAAGWMESRPLAEDGSGRPFLIEGEPRPPAENLPFTLVNVVTQGALDLLRLPVVGGRGFDRTDAAGGLPAILVNEEMVRRYWNGNSPLASRIRLGGLESDEPWRTVVGVVGDMFTGDLDNPATPQAYLPLPQNPRRALGLMVRAAGDPAGAAAAVRREVWQVDPDQPLGDVRTLAQIAADNLATSDALVSLFVLFAGFALVMASTGIYGVLAFAVAQRTREIGIRMALGAHARDVMGMIGRQALLLVGVGVAVGSAAAFVLGRILASVTPGMSGSDPLALGAVAVVLAGAAVVAVWVPARRAVRIDPVDALRRD